MKTKRINERLSKIQNEKMAAYRHVKHMTTELLSQQSPDVYEKIYKAFTEFKKLEDREERYVRRFFPDQYRPSFLLINDKKITDVYWDLPEEVKELWKAVPALDSWRREFR
jgi:hypothetical protein